MEKRLRETLEGGAFKDVRPEDSRRMKAVRGKGNKSTEKRFRALLVRSGVRGWKLNPKGLLGSPDFLFPEALVVVFLDGCYWHGCPRCGHVPNMNNKFWSMKFQRNQERDQRHTRELKEEGYTVLRFWEHELAESPTRCVEAIRQSVAVELRPDRRRILPPVVHPTDSPPARPMTSSRR